MRTIIPAELYTEVSDYINRHNEWGVGMDVLVDSLIDGKIRITPEQFTLIEQAMASMGLAQYPDITYLREHHINA
ncbi:MAG: MafI family immunity protein [Flavobacteriales bacterium]|nr:MafI family immunity protein [Flavobacteriales bacterium]